MPGPCWICLEEDDKVERNPLPCTCIDGGWVHADCLRRYAVAPATRRSVRIYMAPGNRCANVYVPHAPCSAAMPVISLELPSHTNFLACVTGSWIAHLIVMRTSLSLPLLTALWCNVLLLVTRGSWLQLALAVLLVGGAVGTPIFSYELRERWPLYAVAAAVIVLDVDLVTAAVVAAAVGIRNLLYANIRPWVVAQLPRA